MTTKMRALNETGTNFNRDASIATAVSDEALARHLRTIETGIKNWWNGKPYKIRINDRVCGDNTYEIHFNPVFVASGEHYRVHVYNIPISSYTNGINHPDTGFSINRSYVSSSRGFAKFNIGDHRSVTQGGGVELEPHEYGHMLGLLDAYFRPAHSFTGVRYYNNGDQTPPEIEDHVSSATRTHGGMMASMNDVHNYHKGYALSVAKVITRHMNEVWGRVSKIGRLSHECSNIKGRDPFRYGFDDDSMPGGGFNGTK